MTYEMGSAYILLPAPVNLCISPELLKQYKDRNENYLDILFDNYDYASAEEFYARISNKYVKCDKDKQQISISGFDASNEQYIDDCVVIDFANRTITGKDEAGKIKKIDGTEEWKEQ